MYSVKATLCNLALRTVCKCLFYCRCFWWKICLYCKRLASPHTSRVTLLGAGQHCLNGDGALLWLELEKHYLYITCKCSTVWLHLLTFHYFSINSLFGPLKKDGNHWFKKTWILWRQLLSQCTVSVLMSLLLWCHQGTGWATFQVLWNIDMKYFPCSEDRGFL